MAVMREDLQELRALVGEAFTKKAKKIAWASRYMKIVLVLGGALLAGAAAVFGTGPVWPLTIPQILGLSGSALAFIGGIYVAFVEDDSAEALDRSRQALDKATDYERQATEIFNELLEYEDAVTRLKSLYTCYSAGRGTIEQGMAADSVRDIGLVEACLKTMKTDLKVALGFDLTDFWTISVYQTVDDSANQSHMLKCIAHDRSIDCEIDDARTWRIGVGVGGIALAKNDEVVVPDLADDMVGTAFRLDKSTIKPQDSERYRSMFAVPITVGRDKMPWGVAMATSSKPSHFGAENPRGVKPEEAVRALAGLAALAVEVCRKNTRNEDDDTNKGRA